ncbi:hypothetical protein EVAR_38838_1 [Eumeta japonica]|uniref:Uncharacterized protein n=1 Tax=Eumeta variegata TaxID=151549 RepID=A0A4C1XTI3_EUMVA|nr:hypothetical protein EVAR_38838_1 [Eumeta japonica]
MTSKGSVICHLRGLAVSPPPPPPRRRARAGGAAPVRAAVKSNGREITTSDVSFHLVNESSGDPHLLHHHTPPPSLQSFPITLFSFQRRTPLHQPFTLTSDILFLFKRPAAAERGFRRFDVKIPRRGRSPYPRRPPDCGAWARITPTVKKKFSPEEKNRTRRINERGSLAYFIKTFQK